MKPASTNDPLFPAIKGSELSDLKRENAQLKAYLRAFVRATYSHPSECYGGQTPAQDATGMHRVNPGFTYSFGLRELEGPDPIITGGQVMRAMELLGEAPELTPAEEAKNLQAAAVLHSVQGTIAMAVEAIAGREGEPSTPDMLERLAAAGSPAQARAQYLTAALAHLRAMAEGIPAVLKRVPSEAHAAAPAPTAKGGTEVPAGWKPIRTAPRDGSILLLWSSGPTHSEFYIGHYDSGEGDENNRYVGWWDEAGADIDPTHWQPLPAPPVIAASPPPLAEAAGGGSGDLGALSAGADAEDWSSVLGYLKRVAGGDRGTICMYPHEAKAILRRLASTPDLGAQGEPVAWAWEAEKWEGGWLLRVGLNEPEARLGVRNIRPLYEAPAAPRTGGRE